MYSVLVILAVVAAILLILIVLVQESKGGGLTSNMASGNSIMGVHKTTNFVEKTTWTLAAVLVVLSIASHYCTPSAKNADDMVKGVKTSVTTNPSTLPGAGNSASAPTAGTDAAPSVSPEAQQ